MNFWSSIGRSTPPHSPGAQPGGGMERARTSRLPFRRMWRNSKKTSTREQSPYSDIVPSDNEQYSSLPELDTSPSRRGHLSSGCQKTTLELPDTGYPKHQPPEPHQQINTTLPEVSPNDEILIALMGVTGETRSVYKTNTHLLRYVTGAGKSYFIREVSGNSEVVVSGDLYSCTREVRSYPFEFEGAKITLVDTPGFNDTNRSDAEVLQDIADWTSSTYREKRLLSGIIYLHPITHSRMEGSSIQNLRLFQKLCGQKVLRNVFLTTTHWSSVNPATGVVRENCLRNSNLWGGLISKGATLQRFQGSRESGMELIRKLMPNTRQPLCIQIQVVNQYMTLLETDAGGSISEELIAREKKQKKEIEDLERDLQEARTEQDIEMENILTADIERAQKLLENLSSQMKLLAELHAAGVEARKERRRWEAKETSSRTAVAVAIKDIEIIAHVTSVSTSHSTKARLITNINKEEQFKSSPFEITIHYESNNPSNVQDCAGALLGTSVAGAGTTCHVILDGVRHQRKSGFHRTSCGQYFIIFSNALDGL